MTALLPAGPEPMARFFAFLRDRLGEGEVTRWTGTVPRGVDTTLLHHLPAPEPTATGDGDPRMARWRATFRPALCYYRMGPGFVQVKDIRDPRLAARFTLDDPRHVATFLACQQPVLVAALTGAERETVDLLAGERLLLRFGDYVTLAPHRMRRWPIPARQA